MRHFINMFLILFAADGLISVVDELLQLFAGASNLAGVRNLFANAVVLLSLPVYLALGIDRRLPKRVLLPLIVFIVWSLVAAWLVPALADSGSYGVVMAIGQLLLCILPVEYTRRNGGDGLLFPVSAFKAPFFNFRHTLLFAAVSLFVVPAVSVLCALASVSAAAEKATAGFVLIAPDGLYMSDRIYRRDNKTIRLTGMIHVGEQKFYDDLSGSIPVGRSIVLAEGVTDNGNLLENKFGYGKMAGFLGLSSQDKMRLKGRLIESADGEEQWPESSDPAGFDILRADLDTSDFSKTTVYFLNKVGKLMNENNSFAETIIALNEWAEKELSPEANRIIMEDILHKRSRTLISHLDAALERYETITAPWGALHMAEIEEAVLKRGFILQDKKSRLSIDFRRMFPDLPGFRGGNK